MNKKILIVIAALLSVLLFSGTAYMLNAAPAAVKGVLDLKTNYGESGLITSVDFDYDGNLIEVSFREPMHTTTFGMGLNFAKTWTKTWDESKTILIISDVDLSVEEYPTLIIYLMQTEADRKDIVEPNIFVARGAVPVSAVPVAAVKQLLGNKNNLTVTVTETYRDGSTEVYAETFSIDKNSAGTYDVGPYKVYVDTKGNTQIRACYLT